MARSNWFYIIGGTIGAMSWLILGLWVHPPNETPGRAWQCTRHWCHGDDDPWYHEGGALEGKENPRVATTKAKQAMADVGCGARLCDKLVFKERSTFRSRIGADTSETRALQ